MSIFDSHRRALLKTAAIELRENDCIELAVGLETLSVDIDTMLGDLVGRLSKANCTIQAMGERMTVRDEFAKAAMQALLSNDKSVLALAQENYDLIDIAIDTADRLLRKLRTTGEENGKR